VHRFLLPAFLIVCTGAAAVLALNVAVDPFGVWRPRSTPLNLWVTGNASYARLAKAHWLRGRRPDLVLLGNSHSGSAFTAAQFQRHGLAQRPFNFSLLGASMSEMLANMKHAHYTTGASRFLVTVDLLNWSTRPAPQGQEVALARGEDLYQQLFYLRNVPATTFSLDATLRSLFLLRTGYLPTHQPDGFTLRCAANHATWPRLMQSAQRRRNQFVSTRALWLDGMFQQRAAFADMLRFAREQNLDLVLLIPPFHISYYYAMRAANLWEQHLNLLEEMVQQASAVENRARVRVFDFSLPGPVSLAMPTDSAARPAQPLDHWLDTDHFDCPLGERIVASLSAHWRVGEASGATSPEFGRALGPAELEGYDDQFRRAAEQWQARYPAAHRQLWERMQGGAAD